MSGIYGKHPEDRYFEGQLNRYLDEQAKAEVHAELIEQYAEDLYREKWAALPNAQKPGAPGLSGDPGYNTWSAVDDIAFHNWQAIGRAIQEKNAELVGRLIIRAVEERLRKEASDEAENMD